MEIKIISNKKQMEQEEGFIMQVVDVYKTKPQDISYLSYFLEHFFDTHKKNFIVIAKKDDKIISIARFEYKYSIDNYDMKNKVLITGAQTLGTEQNQGYATKIILTGIKKILKQDPEYNICLCVGKSNSAAIQVYKKLGFIIEEQEENMDLPYFNKEHSFFMHYDKMLHNKTLHDKNATSIL